MDSPNPLLEVCCGSAAFALEAVAAGADRIELCDNLVEGGTTPSPGAVEVAAARAGVPVMVMIRPRGGDFLYSDVEFDVMLRDIAHLGRLGAGGMVFGVLEADGRVDRDRTARLVDAARPLPVTFHRAFDVSRDLEESLDVLMEIGVDRVLTSVGRPSVVDDLPRLASLIARSAGTLTVLPGGGIGASNVASVLAVPGVTEVHVGAGRMVGSSMTYRVPDVFMGSAYHPDEYVREEADGAAISAIASLTRAAEPSLKP